MKTHLITLFLLLAILPCCGQTDSLQNGELLITITPASGSDPVEIVLRNISQETVYIPVDEEYSQTGDNLWLRLGADLILPDPLLGPAQTYEYKKLSPDEKIILTKGTEITDFYSIMIDFYYFRESDLRDAGIPNSTAGDSILLQMDFIMEKHSRNKSPYFSQIKIKD
ncbi:MAG: hypothetical protein H6581_24540 [Bacteroidia bacterium]|nr:hypothetical protein [Bacteroidia bacterium]